MRTCGWLYVLSGRVFEGERAVLALRAHGLTVVLKETFCSVA